MAKKTATCRWLGMKEALCAFVENASGHQGASHIKPLHWYVACRLVLEGGFFPDDIVPRPPFEVRSKGRRLILEHAPESGGGGERTIIGGLKTKDIDVTVTKNGIGPVVAVSLKGTLGAFRNLTNRMEEAVGDCTNLHIAYPALVYGFLQVMRGNREENGCPPNDVAIMTDGKIADSLLRYHDVLARLTGRQDLRNATTKYEAVGLCLVDPDQPNVGEIVRVYPPAGSPLLIDNFFATLYEQYDRRFIYSAPKLESKTRRVTWDAESPAVKDNRITEYAPRISLEPE